MKITRTRVLLLDFCARLAITNTMFKHQVAHKRTWYQTTLSQRSMIVLIAVSSDLWPYVLDKRVNRGAMVFSHYLRKSFSCILGNVGNIELESTMFKAYIVEVVVKSCQQIIGGCEGGNFRTRWWTPEVLEAIKLKKEAFQAWLAVGSAEAANRYRLTRRAAATKQGCGSSSKRPQRRTFGWIIKSWPARWSPHFPVCPCSDPQL